MRAFGEETGKPFAGLADRARPRDPDGIEAVRLRSLDQGVLERRGVGQKSRSA